MGTIGVNNMYLTRLYIKNFRSIKELDLRFSKGKNVVIGRNNVGKSNIIRALDIVLGEGTPTYAKSENVTDIDFYSWKELQADGQLVVHSAEDIFIWCELKRDDGETLNYDEMYSCLGFYVHSQIIDWVEVGAKKRPIKGPIRISKDLLPQDYREVFQITEDDSQDKEYVNPKLRNQGALETQFEGKYSYAFAFRALKMEGKIAKDIRFLYREDDSSDWVLSFRAPIRNELLQSAIIPSFRDPQNQLRLSSWTWYGKLMKHLTSKHQESGELKSAFIEVEKVADQIFSNVTSEVMQSALDVAFPGTTLHIQFNPEATKTDLYKSCLIYLDDGFKSQLTEKGSGIQSATIIGLFNYYTRHVNTVTSALLCIEEPEVYLHPHACRVISDRLDDFLENDRNQVIITTHSAEFIRTTAEDTQIILVRKNKQDTEAIPIAIKYFKHLLIDNNKTELFFADKVVVCEGYDDYVLRAIANELFPKKLDEQNVSVVSVCGKDNLKSLVGLVLTLGIKCFLFSDFDYLIRDKGTEREKYGAKAHESIQSLGESFFAQGCLFGENGQEVFRRLVKLRSDLKNKEEEAFYTAKTALEFKSVNVSPKLEYLRKNGVCILNGAIEHLSKVPSFLTPEDNKLSLDKIYDMKARIASGEKISDLIDTSEISEFLSVVFER